jgi:hypothetical protein
MIQQNAQPARLILRILWKNGQPQQSATCRAAWQDRPRAMGDSHRRELLRLWGKYAILTAAINRRAGILPKKEKYL